MHVTVSFFSFFQTQRMRLDKYICSRYPETSTLEAHSLIREGKVSLCGRIVKEISWNIVLQSDEEKTLLVKGFENRPSKNVFHRMILMHKPELCVSMRFKNLNKMRPDVSKIIRIYKKKGIKCVCDVIPEELRHPNLQQFGRLDKNTTGLFIMGTDGGLQDIMMGRNNSCEKVYVADILAKPFMRLYEDAPERFAKGLVIKAQNPTKCLPAKLEILETTKVPYHSAELKKKFKIVNLGDHMNVPEAPPCATRVRITLHEGMNLQVKKMIAACGSKVLKLHRERIGILSLSDYPELEKPNAVLEFTGEMMNRISKSDMVKIRTPSGHQGRIGVRKSNSSIPKSTSRKRRKLCDD